MSNTNVATKIAYVPTKVVLLGRTKAVINKTIFLYYVYINTHIYINITRYICSKWYKLEFIHNVSTDNISSLILQVKIVPLWLYFLCPSYLNITLNFTLNILVGDFRCNTDNTTLLQRRICSIHSKYVLNIKQQLKKTNLEAKLIRKEAF